MTKPDSVSAVELRAEELRLNYLRQLARNEVYPTRDCWEYITRTRMRGLCSVLYAKYLGALCIGDADRTDLHEVAIDQFPKYILEADLAEAVAAVYSDTISAPYATAVLVREAELFDAPSLLGLMNSGRIDFVLEVVDCYRRSYDIPQLHAMERLIRAIDALPVTGVVEERPGIFGNRARYICPNGHSNASDVCYCCKCGLDAQGVTAAERERIDALRSRIDTLRGMFGTVI